MAMTALIDYGVGNLYSAFKAFQLMAKDTKDTIVIVSEPDEIAQADRIVLPGDGAFYTCKSFMDKKDGLFEAIDHAVMKKSRPFLGICVGMQMLATWGYEGKKTKGFDWIPGTVKRITTNKTNLKIPHMGWNDLVIDTVHPVLSGIATGEHVYFVHSYHFSVANPKAHYAHTHYGFNINAIIGKDTIVGTQFHPEKSQKTGLRMIANFLNWSP